MQRKPVLVGAAAVVALALVSWAYQARGGASAQVRTVAVGTLPWAVAIDAATGHLVVANRMTDPNGLAAGQGTVSLLDATGGAVLRTVPVGPDPRAVAVDSAPAPAAPNGRIVVANDDDASLSVLDARSGRLLRTVPVGANPHAVALDAQTARAFVVNAGDGTVSVLDTRRWRVVRTVAVGADFAHTGLAVDARSGRVFVGAGGVVTVLDARSGEALGTTRVPGLINGVAIDPSPVRGEPDGRVFVATTHGLSVLDARDGRGQATLLAGEAVGAVAVDTRRHHLLVAPGAPSDGTTTAGGASVIRVTDEHSGATLRAIAVGMAPVAVAVDARSGRGVAVNAGGWVAVPDPWRWVPGWLRAHLPWFAPGARTRAVPGSVSVFDVAAPAGA